MTLRFRATLRGIKPSVTRTVAVPSDITFMDLHLLLQAVAGWGGRYSHLFRAGDAKIGPKGFEVLEEADVQLSGYSDRKIAYEYGGFTVDIMFLKGKAPETQFPMITDSSEEFPPDECRDLDDYLEVLKVLDDQNDPAYIDTVAWMSTVKASQDPDELNKEFSEKWERMGSINGRIPFNVGATIGALLIVGCSDYVYDTERKILTEESDGSSRYLRIDPENDEFVKTVANMYAESVGLRSDNLLEDLLSDEYRAGWEEYAENFLDEITDRWADQYGYIIESYSDSDVAKMLDVFDNPPEQ